MLEPISVTAFCLGYAALSPYGRHSSAVSKEATQVGKAASEILRIEEDSQSLFGRKAAAISELRAAVSNVLVDADQASAKPQAIRNAEELIRSLPDYISMPSVGLDPDGAVTFDWLSSRTRMFSISITESERLAYAWLDGSDKGHGVARFRSPVMPPQLLLLLKPYAGIHDFSSAIGIA